MTLMQEQMRIYAWGSVGWEWKSSILQTRQQETAQAPAYSQE